MARREKTTMSVSEMREMLGLKKTESYWLVHKNWFKCQMIAGQMRVNIESFEKWYSCQTHYKKVNGPEPGKAMKAVSYSVHDIAKILEISTDSVYELLERHQIETFSCDNIKRVEKRVFYEWLDSQEHYRTPADRERDRDAEENSMTLPEMGRLIFLSRYQVYALVENTPELEIVTIAGRRRVTKASFEKWYSSQDDYRKFEDMTKTEQRRIQESLCTENATPSQRHKTEKLMGAILKKEWYSIKEAAEMLGVSESTVKRLIYSNDLGSKRVGRSWQIYSEDIYWYLQKKQSEKTEENNNGVSC